MIGGIERHRSERQLWPTEPLGVKRPFCELCFGRSESASNQGVACSGVYQFPLIIMDTIQELRQSLSAIMDLLEKHAPEVYYRSDEVAQPDDLFKRLDCEI